MFGSWILLAFKTEEEGGGRIYNDNTIWVVGCAAAMDSFGTESPEVYLLNCISEEPSYLNTNTKSIDPANHRTSQ